MESAWRNTAMTPDANRAMFERISGNYDRMNALLSLGLDRSWRRKAVREIDPRPNQEYLDVGCGSGDMMIELLQVQPQARVVGLDPAVSMRSIAQSKLEAGNIADRAHLTDGDASALSFDENRFHGVMTAFCLRNVVDRLAALKEMLRVTRPGGRVVVLELTVPESRMVRLGHRIYNRTVVPLLARLFADPGAYGYLVGSIEQFPRAGEVARIFEKAGFSSVKIMPLSGGVVTLFVGTK